ncbi:hypothetical protein Tco_1262340 [Tanacetum coccineum]
MKTLIVDWINVVIGGMRSEFCSDLTSSLSDWGWLTVVDIGLGVWASEKPCTEFTFHGDYEKAGLYYMASVKEVNKPHYYNKAPRIDMHEPSTWVGKGIVLDSQRFTGMLYEIKLIAEVLGKNSLPASIITSFCGGCGHWSRYSKQTTIFLCFIHLKFKRYCTSDLFSFGLRFNRSEVKGLVMSA